MSPASESESLALPCQQKKTRHREKTGSKHVACDVDMSPARAACVTFLAAGRLAWRRMSREDAFHSRGRCPSHQARRGAWVRGGGCRDPRRMGAKESLRCLFARGKRGGRRVSRRTVEDVEGSRRGWARAYLFPPDAGEKQFRIARPCDHGPRRTVRLMGPDVCPVWRCDAALWGLTALVTFPLEDPPPRRLLRPTGSRNAEAFSIGARGARGLEIVCLVSLVHRNPGGAEVAEGGLPRWPGRDRTGPAANGGAYMKEPPGV